MNMDLEYRAVQYRQKAIREEVQRNSIVREMQRTSAGRQNFLMVNWNRIVGLLNGRWSISSRTVLRRSPTSTPSAST